jgi:cyclopropane fatty-acyl-phospholipid synthase-like methyltransferase
VLSQDYRELQGQYDKLISIVTEAVRHLRAYLKHAPNADDRAIITGRISLLQTLP